VAAVLLLVASIAQIRAEIIRWEICIGAFWHPTCGAWAEDIAANNYVLPDPAWTGEPRSALLFGASMLLTACALNMLLLARIGRVWRWLLVGPPAICGVFTLVSGITGRGSLINLPGAVLWILVLPVLYLVGILRLSAGTPHPPRGWAAGLLATLAVTSSPIVQMILASGITDHHDVAAWFGLVQAVPLGLLAVGMLAGALLRRGPSPVRGDAAETG
jgi:hypothetical protein